MTESELPRLLKVLQRRVPDTEYRSYALERMLHRPWDTPKWTYADCLRYCLRCAWVARTYHYQRVAQWGIRAKGRGRTLAEPVRQDTLTPLRRVELMEDLGVF